MNRLVSWLDCWGLLGSFLAFVISQWFAFYSFSKDLETTKRIEMIHLARELANTFYHGTDTSPIFRDVRMAIEKCKKLYKSYDPEGNFDHDQINIYLGFFDDLGFYYKKEALDLDTIAQLFGAYVIEAYDYQEVQTYMYDLQSNAKQPRALENFRTLAMELKELSEYKELIKDSSLQCNKKSK